MPLSAKKEQETDITASRKDLKEPPKVKALEVRPAEERDAVNILSLRNKNSIAMALLELARRNPQPLEELIRCAPEASHLDVGGGRTTLRVFGLQDKKSDAIRRKLLERTFRFLEGGHAYRPLWPLNVGLSRAERFISEGLAVVAVIKYGIAEFEGLTVNVSDEFVGCAIASPNSSFNAPIAIKDIIVDPEFSDTVADLATPNRLHVERALAKGILHAISVKYPDAVGAHYSCEYRADGLLMAEIFKELSSQGVLPRVEMGFGYKLGETETYPVESDSHGV